MFAHYYHLQHLQFQEDLAYWQSLASMYSHPILELGCGTGRITIPLAKLGYAVTAIDYDDKMIAVFKQQTYDDKNINLILGDFLTSSYQQQFPLILLPCNTYSLLSSDERKQLLEKVDASLEKFGCFAFSIPNPQMIESLPIESEPEIEMSILHPVSNQPVQISSGWKKEKNQITFTWIYDHLLPTGEIEREGISLTHQISPIEIYFSELESQGFQYNYYGDFERNPFNEDSNYLIIEAKKR
jgi:SAM-dependent methyltransferase